MQPQQILLRHLAQISNGSRYLYTLSDLSAALPHCGPEALKALVGRASKGGNLVRVCRGLFLYPNARFDPSLLLYHAAARLRASSFNYLSLESALSESGAISQIPTNWITLMSSGRSNTIHCGKFGTIEYVHTKKKPNDLTSRLNYDPTRRLWIANEIQAMDDMKATRREAKLQRLN